MKEILRVEDLQICFHTKRGKKIAVDGISFCINEGEVFGIVGESGCGKSVTSMSILKLIGSPGEITRGNVYLDGEDVLSLNEKDMQKRIRGSKVSMIFQDPMTSLNPLITIGEQISETIRVHSHISKKDAKQEAINILKQVGIPHAEERYNSYPHSLSGGMRQRVMIAIAMSCKPLLLIADEPTTALDVTIQAQILDLMKKLRKETNTAIMMITHDLGVVANICDKVAVMYCGKIVELGSVDDILHHPVHPYTKGLIASIPDIRNDRKELFSIRGTVPQIYEGSQGCYFSSRCDYCQSQCKESCPSMREVARGHFAACHTVKGDLQ